MKRVALLIPTYLRNATLLRLIKQCAEFLSTYDGTNVFEICVTDSDLHNPLAQQLSASGVKYFLNQGSGFDDNLFSFWQHHAATYDFVFSMSDDDLFLPGANPMYLLDAALHLGVEAVLFNHRDFSVTAEGLLNIGALFYPDYVIAFDRTRLFHTILTLLPRHSGLLYSTRLLKDNLPTLGLFRDTLHLYAAPLVLACLHRSSAFFDYPLCLFSTQEKGDGAWSHSEAVLHGLAHFLEGLKQILPQADYAVAEAGFFFHYLGASSWLRKLLRGDSPTLSEEEIRFRLAAITTPAPAEQRL